MSETEEHEKDGSGLQSGGGPPHYTVGSDSHDFVMCVHTYHSIITFITETHLKYCTSCFELKQKEKRRRKVSHLVVFFC